MTLKIKDKKEAGKMRSGGDSTSKAVMADEAFVARLDELVRGAGGQNAFAKRMRMSLGGLQRWLAGGEPTRPMLLRITETFGIRLEWLVSGVGPKWREWAPFAHRIRFAVEKLGGIQSAASKSELPERALNELTSGHVGPLDSRRDVVRQLADAAGIDGDWLLGRAGTPPDGFIDLSPESGVADLWGSTLDPADFTVVPLYSVRAAAGAGAVVERERVETDVAFRADWLRSLGVPTERLAVIRAVGVSMEPTIKHGDALLLELDPQQLIEGGIYIIARDGELMIKRPQKLGSKGLVLLSDNPDYQAVTYTAEEAAAMRIVARVRWIGRVV